MATDQPVAPVSGLGPADGRGDRAVILVAGASGSGKSRLAAASGCPRLNLDDFYLDGDQPGLPSTLGIVDWDDPASWDGEAAVGAVVALCRTGATAVPVYDLARSRRTGSQAVDLGDARLLIVEGVFAPEIVTPLRSAGLWLDALYLDRGRTVTLLRRLLRDVAERRKPLPVLLRRGLALWRDEPRLRARALDLGCRPVSMAAAARAVRAAHRTAGS
nr:uridine kinase [uncultured Friedmanniella sp.]